MGQDRRGVAKLSGKTTYEARGSVRAFGFGKQENKPKVPMIAVRDLKRMVDRAENMVVLDVRQPSAYAQHPGAIPGSIRIAPSELPDHWNELPRDRLIVPFCT